MKKYIANLFRVFSKPSLIANRFWRSDIIDPITTWFNPRQRWLTKIIPNTWCDKDHLVSLVNFAILVDFVESENGLSQLDVDWDAERKFVSQEYIDNVMRVYGELKEVYTYIKEERPLLEKQLSDSYPDFDISTSLPYHEAYGETNSLEELLSNRDTWALMKIIEHRDVLWT